MVAVVKPRQRIVERIIRDNTPVPDRREIYEWAGGSRIDGADAKINFGSSQAVKGPFNVKKYPWTKKGYDYFKDPFVREITFLGPPQISGKTKMAESCMCWRIENKPANLAWNTTTNKKAKKWEETRWEQMLEYCPSIKKRLSDDRHKKKKELIVFRDMTWLMVQGAETDGNRESDSVECQINDELHLWERPWVYQMHSRTDAYPETKKILNISLAGNEGSELHERWIKGTQEEWNHHCPSCDKLFTYVFDYENPLCNIKFDLTKAKELPTGDIDLEGEFKDTVYVQCPHCLHKLRWSKELMEQLNARGEYVIGNPSADPTIKSIHINAFMIGTIPWHRLLGPWVSLHVQGGIFQMSVLRDFITRTLCEFWKEKSMTVRSDLKLANYTRDDMLKFQWPEEFFRAMAIDNQRGKKGDVEHRLWAVRAFARNGDSRLVDAGRANSWDEVRKAQLRCGVPDWTQERQAVFTLADLRFEPGIVHTVCQKYRWFGAIGDKAQKYIHGEDSEFAGKELLFSDIKRHDLGFGKKLADGQMERLISCYLLWSSQKVQDGFSVLRSGKGPKWEQPMDLLTFCPEYPKQVNSHKHIKEKTPDREGEDRMLWKKLSGVDDHYYDIECMLTVIGMMAGVYRMDLDKKEEEQDTED